MKLFHFALLQEVPPGLLAGLHARMVSGPELTALPFPAAMRAAREQALLLLSRNHDRLR